jgi:hypothetical protein
MKAKACSIQCPPRARSRPSVWAAALIIWESRQVATRTPTTPRGLAQPTNLQCTATTQNKLQRVRAPPKTRYRMDVFGTTRRSAPTIRALAWTPRKRRRTRTARQPWPVIMGA